MFYVYDVAGNNADRSIRLSDAAMASSDVSAEVFSEQSYSTSDVDFVDDALLNTAPHNVIEKQLLRGDVVGLALMSGAIIWSAMGAFG